MVPLCSAAGCGENGGAPAPRGGVSLTWERRQGKRAEKRAMLKI
nr:MAG TPA: hypothetical protein [Caudoviricetes sp.]